MSARGRILIVDDSRAMKAYLRRSLKAYPGDVLEAGSVEEALRLLSGNPSLDLLVVDFNLPGADGLELVRELRRLPDYSKLPVLMVTTEVEPERIREALDAGVQEYLMKPFTPEMLLEKLALLGMEPA